VHECKNEAVCKLKIRCPFPVSRSEHDPHCKSESGVESGSEFEIETREFLLKTLFGSTPAPMDTWDLTTIKRQTGNGKPETGNGKPSDQEPLLAFGFHPNYHYLLRPNGP